MATASKAKLSYEAGQAAVAMTKLTDSGDQTTFESAASVWSKRSGYAPTVRRQGLVTGGVITPAASGTADLVDISKATAYIDGVLVEVAAETDVAITRAEPADTHKISSVCITNAGVYDVQAGTDDTSFDEDRAATGGPPLILVDSIEIGQVRLSANTGSPAAIVAAEIFQVPGTHQERADYPLFEINYAITESGVLQFAGVTFQSALPEIHDGPAASEVWASYYTPLFAEISNASDFVAAENSHSVSSKQVYNGTVGSSSSSLGQGSFTAELQHGVYESFTQLKDEELWFKFQPDRANSVPYVLTCGKLGITRSWPAGDSINASCTISAEFESIDVASE